MLVGKFIGTICQYNLIPNIGSAFNVICICHYSPIPVRLLPTRESSLNKMRTITIIFILLNYRKCFLKHLITISHYRKQSN